MAVVERNPSGAALSQRALFMPSMAGDAPTRVFSYIYDVYPRVDGYWKVLPSPHVSPYIRVECRLIDSDLASSINQEKKEKGDSD